MKYFNIDLILIFGDSGVQKIAEEYINTIPIFKEYIKIFMFFLMAAGLLKLVIPK